MKPAEYYILQAKEPYKSILLQVQLIIEHSVPDAELVFKWKIPCFYLNKSPLCYLNQSKDYVDVGFWHSAYLSDYHHLMVSEKRKVVKSLRYRSVEEIDAEVLMSVLQEARKFVGKPFLKD